MKTAWTVLLVVMALIASACTGPAPAPTSSTSWSGQVGDDAPATVTVGDAVVTFPAQVAPPGTQATVSINAAAAPTAPEGAELVSSVVTVALADGQQPKLPVTLSLLIKDSAFTAAPASGDHLLVATSVGADGAESFMNGVLDQRTGLFTFTTDHFSDFKVFGFDVGAAWDQVRTALMQGLGLEIPAPDCVDKEATVNGTRYSVVSSPQTYLCVADDGGNLVVTAYPATSMPFRIKSKPSADAVTEPTKVSVTGAGLIAFARALQMIDHKGIAAAFDGASAKLTFQGTPASVHLSLEQNPALLLMAILAKTLDAMGISTIEKLAKVEWVQCFGGANDVATKFSNGLNAQAVGSFVQTFLSCAGTAGELSPFGRVLLAALTAAPTFLVTCVLGIINELTGQSKYEVLLNVTPPPRTTATINLGAGGALTLNGTRYGRGGPAEIRALTKAVGEPDATKTISCGTTSMTQRRWDNLLVYSLTKAVADEGSPATWEAGGISGWRWDSAFNSGSNRRAAVEGPQGITFGTTAATVKAIYNKIDIYSVWTEGNTITAFAGDTTDVGFVMTNGNRVKAIHAGFGCD